ncbi:hypothetical protein [Vibrio aquimaris]
MEIARKNWPDLLQQLPMEAEHKSALRQHWQQLSSDFKLVKG